MIAGTIECVTFAMYHDTIELTQNAPFNEICSITLMSHTHRKPIRVAFGPEFPEFGSWVWLGNDLSQSLPSAFDTTVFRDRVPETDIAIFIKFLPDLNMLREISATCAVIYCPVDGYGSAAEIDADASRLMCCDRIVVHCQRLARYFCSYSPTTYMDHHVKYVIPTRRQPIEKGPLLWVGVRSNLPPFVEWINRNTELCSESLVVLTNVESPQDLSDPARLGFRDGLNVTVENWSPEQHARSLHRCRAAIDIKGDDFRSRHKPPAKALDFLAAGVPLAMNGDSSSVEHLRQLGFEIPPPDDDRWLSAEYAKETQRFGMAISELLSKPRVAKRWEALLWETLNSTQLGRLREH